VSIESLFEQLQEDALPGIWSRGVALARDKAVLLDSERPGEFILRVKAPGKSVSPKVSVWPGDSASGEDPDAHCDCGERVEPCMHLIAAVVSLKNQWVSTPSATTPSPAQTRLVYNLIEQKGELHLERKIVFASGEAQPLRTSLISFMGGLDSGRIAAAPLAATREDFKLDQLISQTEERGALTSAILHALRDVTTLEFEGQPARVNATPLKAIATLNDAAAPHTDAVELRIEQPTIERRFSNSFCIAHGELRPLVHLSTEILNLSGSRIGYSEFARFVTHLLPVLRRETNLEMKTERLPELREIKPRLLLETEKHPERPGELEALARIVYGIPGEPLLGEVIEGRLELTQESTGRSRVIPARDEGEEHRLIQELRAELNLKPRQRVSFQGREAIDFLNRSARFRKSENNSTQFDADFQVRGELTPLIHATNEGLRIEFRSKPGAPALHADTERVFQAWRTGESLVPLLSGDGFARIPKDWLNANIERLEALLAFRSRREKRPLSVLEKLRLAEFSSENAGELSPDLSLLKQRLIDFQGIPEAKLPSDLKAELRPYQKLGVSWLGFLRESGLGALLADDMGLGKTLQALCAVRGRTLIIAPTSVLPSWQSQTEKFRPGLRLSLYYGTQRKLDRHADVTLTSYGTLRQDRALLTAEQWDTIILDEAQQIKNPQSQITKVVHELKGGFRIALTGTPIENRLEDLWSQAQFAQPGLLGTRTEFQSRFSEGRLEDLQRKIKPLILRRLKKDVAPELPPKTETVLYCELSDEERAAYRTIFAGTQDTIVREIEAGGSILNALEALLRLRQICAHPALVPGFEKPEFTPSSKLELMLEQLDESLGLGHNILIFSQWTRFLDLVEKALATRSIEHLRLDGSTPNRAQIIERFQDPAGPRVLLLSLKAGGVGLNLTRADHVMILDPWWNPAVEDQAADRAHRIGQTQPVLVQRLVALGTVEDKILKLQEKKRQLAEAVLQGSASAGATPELTREDLLELLQ
jgi:SNF2 family DNA or RNA helicase